MIGFVVRIAFWLSVVLVLLPGIPAPDAGDAKGPGPIETLSAAAAAVADAGGFCGRQPQACAIGGQILDVVSERLGAGVGMVSGFIGSRIAEQKRQTAERTAGRRADDTLTAEDLSAAWRGHAEQADRRDEPLNASRPIIPLPPRRPA